MVRDNGSPLGTNFTMSIEAASGVTTGISAADRARTIQAATNRNARPTDIVQPGHVFPLMAQKGGVLVRAGHTEAGCDLAQLAGLTPAAVICEILKDDGEMARLPDLIEFAKQHQLKIGTIADLIEYRSHNEKLIEQVARRKVQTAYGELELVTYCDKTTQRTHLAQACPVTAARRSKVASVCTTSTTVGRLSSSASPRAWMEAPRSARCRPFP
jgi:3,4-dihydroxy 2-butanone 4-phosphate synthase/GTP cyclohydrolase II